MIVSRTGVHIKRTRIENEQRKRARTNRNFLLFLRRSDEKLRVAKIPMVELINKVKVRCSCKRVISEENAWLIISGNDFEVRRTKVGEALGSRRIQDTSSSELDQATAFRSLRQNQPCNSPTFSRDPLSDALTLARLWCS